MKRFRLIAKLALFAALAALAAFQAPAAAADFLSFQQLATIGLSDFAELEVVELCLDYERLSGGSPGAQVTFEIEVNRVDIPDLGLRATTGKWVVGPLEIVAPFDSFCVTNLDAKLDLAGEDGPTVDASGLEEIFQGLEGKFSGDVEVVTEVEPNVDEDELRDARDILDSIRANNGLLPQFTIDFTYTLKRNGSVVDTKRVTFVNTNPRPIRVLSPVGPALRPTLRFEVPGVHSGVGYLENEFWIEDADGNNVWQGYVEGGTVKVRYTPADDGRVVSHAYPSSAPDLVPGGSYTIVSRLRDPYGVELDPSRLVGVRHDPEGETGSYEIAVEPVELLSPVGEGGYGPSGIVFEWRDPNPSDIRRGIGRYQLTISGLPPVLVTGTSYRLQAPLLSDWEYTWEVEALDRFGQPVPGSRSDAASFRTGSVGEFEQALAEGDEAPEGLDEEVITSAEAGGGTAPTGEELEQLMTLAEQLEALEDPESQELSEAIKTYLELLGVSGDGAGPVGQTAEQPLLSVGYVAQVFSGGQLVVGDRRFPEGTGLALSGVVPLPTIVVGNRIVAAGRSANSVVAQIEYLPAGATSPQTIRLTPGTYVAGPQCLLREDGSCI